MENGSGVIGAEAGGGRGVGNGKGVIGALGAAWSGAAQPLQKRAPAGLTQPQRRQRNSCASGLPHLQQKRERIGLSAPQLGQFWRKGLAHLAQKRAVSRFVALQ